MHVEPFVVREVGIEIFPGALFWMDDAQRADEMKIHPEGVEVYQVPTHGHQGVPEPRQPIEEPEQPTRWRKVEQRIERSFKGAERWDERGDPVAMASVVLQDDLNAHAVSQKCTSSDFEMGSNPLEVIDDIMDGDVRIIVRTFRLSMSSVIPLNDAVSPCQDGDEVFPEGERQSLHPVYPHSGQL